MEKKLLTHIFQRVVLYAISLKNNKLRFFSIDFTKTFFVRGAYFLCSLAFFIINLTQKIRNFLRKENKKIVQNKTNTALQMVEL